MESRIPSGEAAEALGAVADSRSAMAERLITPWWYHPALGLLYGALAVVVGLGVPVIVLVLSASVFFGAVAALAWTYRRMTGVWISGLEAGPKARRSLTLWGAAALALTAVGAAFGIGFGLWWAPVLCGAATAVLTAVWGRRFDGVLRDELREPA